MEKHQYFDLRLHTDSELAEHFEQRLRSRETIHEWPLSCVQILDFEDGTKRVYKSQARGPSVEDHFYLKAKSPILPEYRILHQSDSLLVMDFEYIDLPRLDTFHLDEEQFHKTARSVLEEIQSIEENPPVYTDLSSKEKWLDCFDETFSNIEKLITSGVFSNAVSKELPKFEAIRDLEELHDHLESDSKFTHGDPNGGNIFYKDGRIKMIDWQRPRRVPANVDLAAMLQGNGYDPLKHVHYTSVLVFQFLKILWPVEAQSKWFKQGDYESWVIGGIRALDETMNKSVSKRPVTTPTLRYLTSPKLDVG